VPEDTTISLTHEYQNRLRQAQEEYHRLQQHGSPAAVAKRQTIIQLEQELQSVKKGSTARARRRLVRMYRGQPGFVDAVMDKNVEVNAVWDPDPEKDPTSNLVVLRTTDYDESSGHRTYFEIERGYSQIVNPLLEAFLELLELEDAPNNQTTWHVKDTADA